MVVPPAPAPAPLGTDEDLPDKGAARSDQLLPYAFQVRVFSLMHGVFKGTLVVDTSLPRRTILVRESMRKVEHAPPHPARGEGGCMHTAQVVHSEEKALCDLVSVEVVNTSNNSSFFESPLMTSVHAEDDPADNDVDGDGDGDGGAAACDFPGTMSTVSNNGKLNRFLVLLLHANGVSESTFQTLVR
jgi:hypothetical protein